MHIRASSTLSNRTRASPFSSKDGGNKENSSSTRRERKDGKNRPSSFTSRVLHWTRKHAPTASLPSALSSRSGKGTPQKRTSSHHSRSNNRSNSCNNLYDVNKHTADNKRENSPLASSSACGTATTESLFTSSSRDSNETTMSQDLDLSRGNYDYHSFTAGSHTFTIDKKYTLIRVIGSGAYGVVISALDTTTNTKVAIKMVPRAFNDEIDAKRILREIKLLKHLKHENIIGICDMMPPLARHVEDFHDVYIVADLMETDLHRIIYSKQSLSIDHVQYFVYQILRALKYMHSANVLHRDLKPSNLLVNSNCDLKICDLGLARGVLPEDDAQGKKHGGSIMLTEYVVTRWYRAPEIMLACHEYTKPIDVWSVGCIFAELLARKPYFPGEDYIDQLTIISEKLGKLPKEDLDFVTSEKAKRFMTKLPDKPAPSLRRQFPGTPPDALDLLGKMLQIHPKKRITVAEALKHPFLAALHSPADEPVADAKFDFGFEEQDLHRVKLQELIWEEVSTFRPNCLPVPSRKSKRRTHAI